MPQSPRLTDEESQTTQRPQTRSSASMLLFATALDTTWRAFLPTIGGTFIGIAIDNWLNIAPIATILSIILGVVVAALLIAQQIRKVKELH